MSISFLVRRIMPCADVLPELCSNQPCFSCLIASCPDCGVHDFPSKGPSGGSHILMDRAISRFHRADAPNDARLCAALREAGLKWQELLLDPRSGGPGTNPTGGKIRVFFSCLFVILLFLFCFFFFFLLLLFSGCE